MDGESKTHNDESTESENSTNPDSSYTRSHKGNDKTNSYPVQRISRPPGSLFYQSRTKGSRHNKHSREQGFKPKVAASQSKFEQIVQYMFSLPTSMLLLITLTLLLILLFFSSTYLVLRLDNIQEKMDFALPSDPAHLASRLSLLHTQSSKKVQEYLNTNLEQISKVLLNLILISPNLLFSRFVRVSKNFPNSSTRNPRTMKKK